MSSKDEKLAKAEKNAKRILDAAKSSASVGKNARKPEYDKATEALERAVNSVLKESKD